MEHGTRSANAGRPDGFSFEWLWLDLGCLALIGGVMAKVYLKNLNAHPAFPQKDPRMAEGLDIYVPTGPVKPAGSHE